MGEYRFAGECKGYAYQFTSKNDRLSFSEPYVDVFYMCIATTEGIIHNQWKFYHIRGKQWLNAQWGIAIECAVGKFFFNVFPLLHGLNLSFLQGQNHTGESMHLTSPYHMSKILMSFQANQLHIKCIQGTQESLFDLMHCLIKKY